MSRAHRFLVVAASTLGIAAAFMGGIEHTDEMRTRGAHSHLAAEIAHEKDHITPLELAEWIRDGKEGLRLIDVRSSTDPDAETLPTAESVDLEALMATSFAPHETIVVYSEEGVHAAQVWVLLRALGHENVFFLRGGRAAWVDEVLHPTLAEDASDETKAAFDRASLLSRYFGGVPRAGTRRKPTSQPRPRGC